MIFFLFFPENRIWHFMRTASICLQEIFSRKNMTNISVFYRLKMLSVKLHLYKFYSWADEIHLVDLSASCIREIVFMTYYLIKAQPVFKNGTLRFSFKLGYLFKWDTVVIWQSLAFRIRLIRKAGNCQMTCIFVTCSNFNPFMPTVLP